MEITYFIWDYFRNGKKQSLLALQFCHRIDPLTLLQCYYDVVSATVILPKVVASFEVMLVENELSFDRLVNE